MYKTDKRTVVTLDAGGTNFVFSAMRGCEFIVDPITKPSNAHDLDLCLATMAQGFEEVMSKLDRQPVAISFAFPGPADYKAGIIGGYLPNFPSFRQGVALGQFLENKFGMPVFINNEGDLFALGEATEGVLPHINRRIRELGGSKQYHNLLGYTFGTGLGIGSVIDGRLNTGNNSCVETFCLPHKGRPDIIAEEGASIRAIKRYYSEFSGDRRGLTPFDIFKIAEGTEPGDRDAATKSFAMFGEVAGDAFASAVTLTDSLIVVGGGLTGAMKYIRPALLKELRADMATLGGDTLKRVQMQVFDLDDPDEFKEFATAGSQKLKVYGSDRTVDYDPIKRTGIAVSTLGASKAISIGAYVYALQNIEL